jgi:SRSO17 transposase
MHRARRRPEPELKFCISNADAETPLSTLALVACTRCHVEEFLEDSKSYLGITHYETRSWVGWHHHMTLVGLAHLFVTLVQRRLQPFRTSGRWGNRAPQPRHAAGEGNPPLFIARSSTLGRTAQRGR